ncbi:hypothetical protein NLI96_g6801 [Meripilus lineatus]|uniref:Uncharacterized protein n=1 Tax=Meripilus lineatus TaxID=2056292 RepID=A0AAD5V207_9APHY|nr:hypothetical protein NLI96_g6801 [Physisporinus lineatus]
MHLTATFPLLFGTTIEYRWAEDKQHNHWTLTYDLKAEWNAIEFGIRTATPIIPTEFRRGYIISSKFKFWYNDDFPIFDWVKLDEICDNLEHLEEVCIEFRVEGAWVKEIKDPTKSILRIAQAFLLARRRRGLSLGFIVDGKAIPWLLLDNVVIDDSAIVEPTE